MKRDEAKLILQSYRGNDQDRDDPQFAEALALVETEPELKQWFERERAFDAAMASHVQAIPVPPGLKQEVLSYKPKESEPWLIFRVFTRPALAMLGGLVLLAAVTSVWWWLRPAKYSAFCAEIAGRSWEYSPHLQLVSKDLAEIRTWLASHNAPTDFEVPAALEDAQVRGCSLVEWHGHQIPVLCLLEQPRHIHLLIADSKLVAGGPKENYVQLGDYGSIRTASWKSKDKTYVVTGYNTSAFVKKFRQGKHWNWSS